MRKIISLLVLSFVLIQLPQEVSAATQPKAPQIVRVDVTSPTKVTVTIKLDTAHKKSIKSIQYSSDAGRSWKSTTKTSIILTTRPETTYAFQIAQQSTSGKRSVVKRTFSTGPVLPGFTVQQLMWSDEFNSGATLSDKNWVSRYCGQSAANGGGTCYNNESQYFLPSAISVHNGSAVITTTRINSRPPTGTCLGADCAYTSGRFDTLGKVSFQYGYIEARIQMPAGEGNWPAFWMMGTDIVTSGWPVSGEMDIAEQGGYIPIRNSAALHYSTTASGCCDNHLYDSGEIYHNQPLSDDFHTYGIAWTEDQMTLYFDRVAFWSISKSRIRSEYWPGNKPYFLIFDNAIGPRSGGFGGLWGDWAVARMTIDYVRAYRVNKQGSVYLG